MLYKASFYWAGYWACFGLILGGVVIVNQNATQHANLANLLIDIIKIVGIVGILGAIAGVIWWLILNPQQSRSLSDSRFFECGGAWYWGIFWTIVLFVRLSYFSEACDRSSFSKAAECDIRFLAEMILLIPAFIFMCAIGLFGVKVYSQIFEVRNS